MRVRLRPRGAIVLLALAVVLAVAAGAAVWLAASLAGRGREIAASVLSAALRRDVAIGRVSGDPWRGIVVERVEVSGARPDEPPILTAQRVTMHLDPAALARDILGGRGALPSVSLIVIEEAAVRVTRDVGGAWNLSELLPAGAGAGAVAFRGRIHLLGGTVALVDRLRVAPRVFEARFTDVSGSVDFATAPRLALRASFVEARGGVEAPGRLGGAYTTTTRVLDLDVQASRLDAGIWGPYLLPLPALRITGGDLDAAVHLLHAPAGLSMATDIAGRVTVRRGAAVLPDRAATVREVSGELEIIDRWVRTAGLRGVLNGAPVEIRGEASFYGEPRVDLAARSGGADLRALGRVFFPSLLPRLAGVARGEVRIVGTVGAPRVVGRIEGARGRFDGQAFESASTDIAYVGGLLIFTRASGVTAGGLVRGHAFLSPDASRYYVSLAVRGADVAALGGWVPAAPAAAGTASGTLTAFVDGRHLTAAGSGTITQLSVADLRLDRVQGGIRLDRGRITLDTVQVRHQGTRLAAAGLVAPDGTLDLRAQVTTPDVGRLPVPFGGIAVQGRGDFLGVVRGTIRSPAVAGTVHLGEGQFGPVAFETLGGRVAARGGTLFLEQVRARDGFAWYRADGSVQWTGEGRLALDLGVERASAARLAAAFNLPADIRGRLDGGARLEGPLARPSAHGALSLTEGRVLGQEVSEATAGFRWDGRRLVVEGGTVHLGSSVIHMAGTIDRLTGLALDVATTRFDLADVALPPVGASVTGRVDATGRITGPPSAPTLAVQASSLSLSINRRRFDSALGTVEWSPGVLRVNPLALRVDGESYEIVGDVALSESSQTLLQATVQNGRLSTLLTLGGGRLGLPLDGVISGMASVRGALANPEARLDLRLTEGHFGPHGLVGGHADLVMRDGSVTIQGLELRPERGRIAATGRFDLRGDSEIEVSGTDLDLDLLRPAFGTARPVLGATSFTLQLGGPLAAPEIGFDVEVTRGGVQGMTFDSLVASGFYRDGLLQVSQALLAQDGNRLRISGSVPFNPALRRLDERAPVDLRLTLADVNLGLLRLLSERIEDARGAVEGEVRVNGTAAAPRFSGGVAVRGGAVRVRGLGTPLEEVRLDLRFEESAVRIAEGTARMGGGTLRLAGAAQVAASPSGIGLVIAPDAPIVLSSDGARLTAPPLVDAKVEGAVRAWGTTGDPRRPLTLDGRVTVSEGTVAVADSGAGGEARVPVVFAGLRFGVGRDLAVQAGGLRLGLQPAGAIVLGGTLRAPTLEGTVEAERGTVTIAGNPFELLEGTATFQTPLGVRPRVFARARTQVGPTRIVATIRGIAPDALELPELEADPPLPRERILALLGQRAGLADLAQGDFAAALRAELTRRLFAPVTLAIGRAIGLTELSVEYDFERPLRLRVGKLLFSNLYLSVTTTFEAQQQWLWALEYRFARGWELALRVNQFGHREAIVWYATRF